jgi:DNA polymerase elongation subunit (family B)
MSKKEFYINVEKLYPNKIGYTYIDENGTKQRKINTAFKPTLHTLSKYSNEVFTSGMTPSMTSSKLKTIDGMPLVQQRYSITEYGRMNKLINDGILDKSHYHGYIDASVQFLYEKFHNQGEPDLSKIRTGFLDIEVYVGDGFPYPEYANDPIVSISLKDSITKTIYVWGLKEYDKSKNEIMLPDADIIYIKCDDEKMLLQSFLKIYKNLDFDNLTGWNTNKFDLPYLYNRINRLFDYETANKLSPYKSVWYQKKDRSERSFPLKLRGMANLDYLELYKKYMYGSRESYALAAIAELELGTTKIDYSEYHDLNDLFENNHQKFIEYNIYDAELVDMLDQKLGLLDLAMTIAYKTNGNYMSIFSPVMTWDILIYNFLRASGICVPPKQHIDTSEKTYAGAFVRDPVKGLHDWIVTYDLNALYPMIHIGLNISPDTIIDRNRDVQDVEQGLDSIFFDEATVFDSDKIQSANGWRFDKNKVGFIPKMLAKLYSDRVKIKKDMLEVKQNFINVEAEINRRGLKI